MYGLIMIGGRGTRFWPLSKTDFPKQLHDFNGKGSMIRITAERLKPLIKPEDLYIVTSKNIVDPVKKILNEYDKIIGEPEGRNTAPCIAMITAILLKEHKDSVLGVFPGDHFIEKNEEFINILKIAEQSAEQDNTIVTIGIKPDSPHTGYGYTEYDKKNFNKKIIEFDKNNLKKIFKVNKFYEKPDKLTAEKFIKSGNYLWNAGIFIFKISTMTDAFKKFQPEMYESILRISNSDNLMETIEHEFLKMKKISIDYAIMEHSSNIVTIPADINWNDIGSWSSLSDVNKTDKNNNVIISKNKVIINSSNNIVHCKNKLVSLIDVDNLVVVDNGESLLICKKKSDQKVKDAVEYLEKNNMNEYL